ncbi:UAA-domain-containing protein [Trametopsis cervina]|nr:UAA-domain-containing protein [Trametopsis cervina]
MTSQLLAITLHADYSTSRETCYSAVEVQLIMNKRRRPPSEHRAERTNRMLAEMVLRAPRNRVAAGNARVESSGGSRDPSPVRVKEEAQEDPPPQLSKPVAMSLVDFSYVLTLVFGGCCSNVYTYEYLLKLDPHLGTALTFSQMVFVTLLALPSFLMWRRLNWLPIPISIPTLSLKPRQVPISQWALQVLVLTSGSLFNNWAYGFSVPLTVLIIFRSAGLAVSMLFGRVFLAKRYSSSQIGAVLLVTLGVIVATTSRPTASNNSSIDVSQYTTGVIMLTVSLGLTGVLGLLQERAYTIYGPCWQEGVFYTHALSLPIFLLLIPSVKRGFKSLSLASIAPSVQAATFADDGHNDDYSEHLIMRLLVLAKAHLMDFLDVPPSAEFDPRPYLTLAMNLITQLVCVSGVNQMTSRVSSVSTNIVLTMRKAISLCFSVWWFGNGWNFQLGSGASMVFLGSILYTMVTSRTSAPLKAQVTKVDEQNNQLSPQARKLERANAVKLEPAAPEAVFTKSPDKGKARMQ